MTDKKPTHRRPDGPTALLVGAAAALAHVLRYGYAYGTGDHDDLLPPILARIDPALFAEDAYVQAQLDGWTVRAAFRTLVTALGKLFALPVVAGVMHVLLLAGVGAGVFALARALKAGRLAGLVAAVGAVALVPTWTLGANAVVYTLLTPEGVAWALVIPALALHARSRVLPAAALLGFAAWFHALAGLLLLGALALAHGWGLWRETGKAGAVARGVGVFLAVGLAVAAPVVAPALLRQTAEAGAALPGGLTPFALYAEIRFPHHLLPSRFPPETWVRLAGLLGAAWVGARLAARRGKPLALGWPLRFLAVAGAMAAVALVMIVGLESLGAARAQVFKLSVLANVLACVGVGAGVASLVPKATRRRVEKALRRPQLTLPLAAACLAATGALVARADTRGPAADVAAWAQAETPPDAVFVVPPSLSGFRVPAERSVVATWKAVPFRADLAGDWWARLSTVAPLASAPEARNNVPAMLALAYATATDAERREAGARYGAGFAVLPAGIETTLPVAYRDDDWTVVRLGP